MIRKHIEYYVSCDVCGWCDPGANAQMERKHAREAAKETGFVRKNGQDLCAKCAKELDERQR